jgi:SAM-dependent methyltransferase
MKQVWPAPERNKAPILEVLRRVLPAEGTLLEIASGTGQHAAYFAANLPSLTWIPSDYDEENLASIRAHLAESGLINLESPLALDVLATDWGLARFGKPDAIFCANMIHIAPWECATSLIAGAGRALGSRGVLVLYGPYRFSGAFTSESNASFDADLRRRNPAWGVRDVDDLKAVAAEHDLSLSECIAMPANNHVLVFHRSSDAGA